MRGRNQLSIIYGRNILQNLWFNLKDKANQNYIDNEIEHQESIIIKAIFKWIGLIAKILKKPY